MQLYLIRHAEKQTALHDDPELSNRGLLQAKKMPEYFENRKLPWPDQIFCSTKIRTQQTMQILAQERGLSLHITEDLEEKSSLETPLEFETRVEKKLNSLKEGAVSCLCSHYDWVIVASQILLQQKFMHYGACHHWPAGQVILFEKKDDVFQVKDYGVVTI